MWQLWTLILAVIWFWPDAQQWAGIDFRYNTAYRPPALFENFSGGLLANKHLSKADKLFVGELHGPECFAQRNGKTYTSLADGRIVELLSDTYRTVVHLSPSGLDLDTCRQVRNFGKCARPLGIKFDSQGALYAVDPYHGIHKIDVDTGSSELILDIEMIAVEDGSKAIFLDDLEILERPGKRPLFYLSDASTKWLLHDVGNVVSEADNTGRLLAFDPETGSLKILLSDLYFPNGLQLTDDKSSLIICILLERKLVKYSISTGSVTDFVNLPGEPDNVKRSRNTERETYWVGLYSGRNRHNPSLMLDKMVAWGGLKRFAFRLTRMIGSTMAAVGKQTGMPDLENAGFFTKIGGPLFEGGCKYGMVVEVAADGEIISSLHSPDGSICSLSEAYEYESDDEHRKFYLGSFSNEYLGHLVVKKSELHTTSGPVKTPSPTPSTPKKTPTKSQTTSQQGTNSNGNNKPSKGKKEPAEKKRHQEL